MVDVEKFSSDFDNAVVFVENEAESVDECRWVELVVAPTVGKGSTERAIGRDDACLLVRGDGESDLVRCSLFPLPISSFFLIESDAASKNVFLTIVSPFSSKLIDFDVGCFESALSTTSSCFWLSISLKFVLFLRRVGGPNGVVLNVFPLTSISVFSIGLENEATFVFNLFENEKKNIH